MDQDEDPEFDEIAGEDLTPVQRLWQPVTDAEAQDCWPNAWKVEIWDGALQFMNYIGGWDWRSVALAARTYPGWRVVLRHPGRLSVQLPDGRQAPKPAPVDVATMREWAQNAGISAARATRPGDVLTVTLRSDGTVAVWPASGWTPHDLAETLRAIADGFDNHPRKMMG